MDTPKAREIAFKILYEMEVRGAVQLHELLALDEDGMGDKVREYVEWVAEGVSAKNDEYNKIIMGNLQGWKFDRVSKLSIAAIKLALFEMESNEKINQNIAISEAVKLAVKFEGEEAAGFVNGVLGSFVRSK